MFGESHYYLVALLYFLYSSQKAPVQATGIDTRRGSQTAPSGQPTCPNRSVNYITERLPQQCLKTPWSRPTNPATSINLLSNSSTGTQAAKDLAATDLDSLTVEADASTPSSGPQATPGGSTNTYEISSHTAAIGPESSVIAQTSQDTEANLHSVSDIEPESPLDNANFLSFEEWKKQNLAKAGQSADHIGGARAGVGADGSRRRPGSINNALDSLGEDTELEIDFGGFVNPVPPVQATSLHDAEAKNGASAADQKYEQDIPKAHPRGKDAGRTCKERSNYASFDCAATIMKTNREVKGSTSILVENKDSYMLNECSAKNKFFIVELCDDILIDTVVLANFEFFSSIFRTFRVSVSDKYPVKVEKWRDLGTFEARNSRDVQAFLIETPQIWARYLRIEFLTHYGNEYYCPVSLVRVHGTTMMEEFNHDLKASRDDDGLENEAELVASEAEESALIADREEEIPEAAQNGADGTIHPPLTSGILLPPSTLGEVQSKGSSSRAAEAELTATTSLPQIQMDPSFMFNYTSQEVCYVGEMHPSTSKPSSTTEASMHDVDHRTRSTIVQQTTITTYSNDHSTQFVQNISSSSADPSSPISSALRSSSITKSISSPSNEGQSSYEDARNSPSASIIPRATSSATQPPASNPTTQESFFKSVHKRLQLLESNSTLSLQYIEEQSRILRDAFSKVEKRQLAKASTFFETLNTTVLTEMRDFRSQYDQLWQSTVLELSSQRTQNQQEILAISTRLSLLADEVALQRRIAIMQFLLIVVCLGLVLFGRSSSPVATYLEMPPIVQNAINRSSANLSRYSPSHDSPNGNPSPTIPSSRYSFFGRMSPNHLRGPSEESRPTTSEGMSSPDAETSPPAPTISRSEYEILSNQDSRDLTFNKQDSTNKSPGPKVIEQSKVNSGLSTPNGTSEEKQEKLNGELYLKPG
ncbi:MAG: hypothetical protein Q9195_002570 [Heterodermia aff. obscurata]